MDDPIQAEIDDAGGHKPYAGDRLTDGRGYPAVSGSAPKIPPTLRADLAGPGEVAWHKAHYTRFVLHILSSGDRGDQPCMFLDPGLRCDPAPSTGRSRPPGFPSRRAGPPNPQGGPHLRVHLRPTRAGGSSGRRLVQQHPRRERRRKHRRGLLRPDSRRRCHPAALVGRGQAHLSALASRPGSPLPWYGERSERPTGTRRPCARARETTRGESLDNEKGRPVARPPLPGSAVPYLYPKITE